MEQTAQTALSRGPTSAVYHSNDAGPHRLYKNVMRHAMSEFEGAGRRVKIKLTQLLVESQSRKPWESELLEIHSGRHSLRAQELDMATPMQRCLGR